MSNPQLTHGSLFAGIGGFDLGFERAGFKTVWQVEIDEYCRRVLERHFPKASRYSGIQHICREGENWRSLWLDTPTVITGGFPCQDISFAGDGAGIDGERSGLWREYLRIIRELRPKFAVVENVAALLRRGMGRVLGGLAEIGYDAIWDGIPASAFGAPGCRDRIWIIAYPERSGLATNLLASRGTFSEWAERSGAFWDGWWMYEPSRFAGRWVDAAPEARVAAAAWEHAPCEPLLLGIPDGISERVDRLNAVGNACLPQIAQWIAERIKAQIESETPINKELGN